MTTIRHSGLKIVLFSLALFVFSIPAYAAEAEWDLTGSWTISSEYDGISYPVHDITIVQDDEGTLSGTGEHPSGGTWEIRSGSVSGSTFSFSAEYIEGNDVVPPGAILEVSGVIAPDGTVSGTWSDGSTGEMIGSWESTSGAAMSRVPEEDFWHGFLFETELIAAREVHDATPAIATAHAGAWFAGDGVAMNYWLSVFSEEPVQDAHFHCGALDENGPAVVSLMTEAPAAAGKVYGEVGRKYLDEEDILPSGEDCESVIGYSIISISDLARAMRENDIYVNIHTPTHPEGAARGQLMAYPGWNE